MKERMKHHRSALMVLCMALAAGLLLSGCSISFNAGGGGDSEETDPAKYGEETFAGTTWIASDGSELVFLKHID